ncbi:MAG TPA: RNA polymerase sigma-70 factor [Chthoniobacterales bacterium]
MTNQGVELFEKHRPFLFGIAYRMLGSAADAEDMVQETFLRWQKNEPGELKSAEAWLATVVTRLCINHLKSARVQREKYVGAWLPEPIVADYATANPRENAEQAESLSIAFLVILETLSPTERAVYLLKEVFGYEFGEVARIVRKSEPNCRQLLSRARARIAERRPRFQSSADQQRRLVEAFLKAINEGDVAGLLAILSEEVTLITDGGAETPAPRRTIAGADSVSRMLLRGAPREAAAATVTRLVSINGWPGFLACRGQTPRAAIAFDIDGERIRTIYLIANPEKLASLPGGRPKTDASFDRN